VEFTKVRRDITVGTRVIQESYKLQRSPVPKKNTTPKGPSYGQDVAPMWGMASMLAVQLVDTAPPTETLIRTLSRWRPDLRAFHPRCHIPQHMYHTRERQIWGVFSFLAHGKPLRLVARIGASKMCHPKIGIRLLQQQLCCVLQNLRSLCTSCAYAWITSSHSRARPRPLRPRSPRPRPPRPRAAAASPA